MDFIPKISLKTEELKGIFENGELTFTIPKGGEVIEMVLKFKSNESLPKLKIIGDGNILVETHCMILAFMSRFQNPNFIPVRGSMTGDPQKFWEACKRYKEIKIVLYQDQFTETTLYVTQKFVES